MSRPYPRIRKPRVAFATMLACLLAACNPFGGSDDDGPRLPGERISVLELERTLEADPRIADLDVGLPRPYANPEWPQAGGYANHAMHHLALGESISRAWRADVGRGSDKDSRILASPVAAEGLVFAMDARAKVSAFDATNGRRRWRVSLEPEDEDEEEIGGGLAYDEGRVFVATAVGDVYALEATSGKILWRQPIGIPVRAQPAAAAGRVFVVSYDNQLHTLAAADGRILWTHLGVAEIAGLVGGASPAIDGNTVVVPYSSGEIFALRVDNGTVAWSDSLTRASRQTGLGVINDINGAPVIDRGIVYAVGYSGRTVAIDLRSGQRIWDRDISGAHTPWIAGEFIFLLTADNQLVALSRREGRIRWVRVLARFEDEEDQEDPIYWSGPVLAGDRLIVVSSHGESMTISPYTGEILGRLEISDGTFVAPIVADNTLYVLTEDARLTAWR